MFGTNWTLSPRQYDVMVQEDYVIPLRDGTRLAGVLYRPRTETPVPLLLGFHPYPNDQQTMPLRPVGFGLQRGHMEAGDPTFYARRGYAHGIFNVRGTGKSSGVYQAMGKLEGDDVAEAIEWLARRPWCDGNVGMFGVSYFSRLAIQVAARAPKPLRAIFAPYGLTDLYRDLYYHGGIFTHGFVSGWRQKLDALRYESLYRQRHGEEAFRAAISRAQEDDELMAIDAVRAALERPDDPRSAIIVDLVLEPLDGEYYTERRVDYGRTHVPGYFGACWNIYGLQLGAAFRNFEQWQGPKKLLIGPPHYLDRPLYQLQFESLRWFDHWLKGNDTGFMDESPVRLFQPGPSTWRAAEEWPLKETRWLPFYLHEDGTLSEHELFEGAVGAQFEDSPFGHGALTYRTPPLVERTEVLGPAALTLYASTSDTELLVFASVFKVDAEGREDEISRGWLRASQRELDPEGSRPWAPRHLHRRREELRPGEVYRLDVAITPFAATLAPGERLGLRLKAADDEARPDPLRATAFGHVFRQEAARIRIHASPREASCLAVPIVSGNVQETYFSGGRLEMPGPLPLAKMQRPKPTPEGYGEDA